MTPVATLTAGQLLLFLLQVSLLLTLALCLGRLAARLGLPAVVGELLVGVLLGPSLLGHTFPQVSAWLLPRDPAQFHLLDAFAQVGVLLLVGLTGMQMDLGLVRRRKAAAAYVSLAGLIIPLGLGVAIGFLLPASLRGPAAQPVVFALFLGVAMCVSAIPVIAKTLIDMNLLHRNIGQLTLTAGIIDDIFGWLMLSVVSAMATQGARAGHAVLSLLYLVITVAIAVLLGRRLAGGPLGWAARSGEPGAGLAAVVAIILLTATATHAMGLEPVFGAFVAGMVLRASGKVPPSAESVLRVIVLWVLAPIFFATAGLRMDLTALADPRVLGAALIVLAVAIAGKFIGAYVGARASRLTHWEALALGAGMNGRGVIEVIVAMVGLRIGVLNTAAYTIIILVAVVTSLMAPPLLRWAFAHIERSAEEGLREMEARARMSAQPRA
ncbi:cation:proton antiporter [Nonomuraea sp. NPDC050643]|uniref:cation:proton antiporter n=1 Tax=Nonomuraea sp. NPDC050643 TaxID=3155660 RepID=UPI0033C35118